MVLPSLVVICSSSNTYLETGYCRAVNICTILRAHWSTCKLNRVGQISHGSPLTIIKNHEDHAHREMHSHFCASFNIFRWIKQSSDEDHRLAGSWPLLRIRPTLDHQCPLPRFKLSACRSIGVFLLHDLQTEHTHVRYTLPWDSPRQHLVESL